MLPQDLEQAWETYPAFLKSTIEQFQKQLADLQEFLPKNAYRDSRHSNSNFELVYQHEKNELLTDIDYIEYQCQTTVSCVPLLVLFEEWRNTVNELFTTVITDYKKG